MVWSERLGSFTQKFFDVGSPVFYSNGQQCRIVVVVNEHSGLGTRLESLAVFCDSARRGAPLTPRDLVRDAFLDGESFVFVHPVTFPELGVSAQPEDLVRLASWLYPDRRFLAAGDFHRRLLLLGPAVSSLAEMVEEFRASAAALKDPASSKRLERRRERIAAERDRICEFFELSSDVLDLLLSCHARGLWPEPRDLGRLRRHLEVAVEVCSDD